MANNINFGKIYESTWWGVGVTSNSINWGKSYLDLAKTSISFSLTDGNSNLVQDGNNNEIIIG